MYDDGATPGTRGGVDDAKLQRLPSQMLGDLSGAASVAMVRMGDAPGLYRALHVKGAMTYAELTREAKVNERYLREWLSHQAAACTTWAAPREWRHMCGARNPDGTWMEVEPIAGNRLEDNLNPAGYLYYAGSTLICMPTSLSQEVGAVPSAQAGEARLRGVIGDAEFRRVQRAAETPFNVVLEARP